MIDNNIMPQKVFDPTTNRDIGIKLLKKRIRTNHYTKKQFKLINENLNKIGLGYNKSTNRIVKFDNRKFQKQFKKEIKERKQYKKFEKELIREVNKKHDIKAVKLFENTFNNMVINDGKTQINLKLFKYYSKKNAFREILSTIPELTNKVLIKYYDENGNERYYTLNNINRHRLLNTFGEVMFDNVYADKTNSDAELLINTDLSNKDITFSMLEDLDFIDDDDDVIDLFGGSNQPQTTIINELMGGAMFPYLLKDNILHYLKRYGVYSDVCSSNYNENCLIKALKNSGKISLTDIDKVKVMIKTREIPKRKLKEIANKLNICICLNQIDRNTEYHGDKKNKQIDLGLIENHYFINDKHTNITSYAIKNYFVEGFTNKKDWNRFIKKDERTKSNYMNSFLLIKYLVDNKDKFLKPIPACNELYKTSFYDKFEVEDLNSFNDDNFKEIEYKEKDDYEGNVVYFDFETLTEGKHIPYLCNTDLREQSFYGSKCGKQLLNHLISLGYREQKILVERINKKGEKISKLEQKPLTLIAHNLGYDFSFISKYLDNIDIINKGKLIVVATAEYQGLKIRFMDSLMMLPMKLKDFPKTFGLDSVKEIMPYDLYTQSNLYNKRGFLSVEECLKSNHLKSLEDRSLFLTNCKKWNCFLEGKVNLKLYSSKYCYMDCIVLKKGYEKFRSLMKELNGLDTLNYYSIASIAQTHLIKMGCYDGVEAVSGVVREFIQKCVVGGRCMTTNNQKHSFTGGKKIKLADYDACSLYPSAMYRMEGFLMGKPQVLTDADINLLKNDLNLFDGFFVKIKVLSVGKEYKIPCMSKVNKESGIREWTNKMIGSECYVDKTTLEDWITFHDIEYDIIEGYYYNEGRNSKINEVIKHIYDERRKYKNELSYTDINGKKIINHYTIEQIDTKGFIKNEKKLLEKSGHKVIKSNPLQAVLKLIMNSGYGKSILKPIDTDEKLIPINEYEITEYDNNNTKQHHIIKFKHFKDINKTISYINSKSKYILFGVVDNVIRKISNKKDGCYNFTYERSYKKHIKRNFNYIKEFDRCIDNKYMRCKMYKPINEHFNSAHIGVEILSMSKRIMFEVMTTAEDNNLFMCYTDTDSIHIKYDDIPILEKKYKEKYNRDLKGNELGQFHIDFEMDNNDIDTDTIYSDESLFLMKKCYIDKLKGFNKKTKKWDTDYHIRMKGVPNSSILLKAYQDYNNDPLKLFEDLYRGTEIEFDLTKGFEGGFEVDKMKLEHKYNYEIHSKSKFDRKITIRYNEYNELEYN